VLTDSTVLKSTVQCETRMDAGNAYYADGGVFVLNYMMKEKRSGDGGHSESLQAQKKDNETRANN